jgi:hypothetical protein
MRRNIVAINNVLKKKNGKTKLSISSIFKKTSTNIILKNKKKQNRKTMWKNIASIHGILKKNDKAKILTKSIFKK